MFSVLVLGLFEEGKGPAGERQRGENWGDIREQRWGFLQRGGDWRALLRQIWVLGRTVRSPAECT